MIRSLLILMLSSRSSVSWETSSNQSSLPEPSVPSSVLSQPKNQPSVTLSAPPNSQTSLSSLQALSPRSWTKLLWTRPNSQKNCTCKQPAGEGIRDVDVFIFTSLSHYIKLKAVPSSTEFACLIAVLGGGESLKTCNILGSLVPFNFLSFFCRVPHNLYALVLFLPFLTFPFKQWVLCQ
ncbi:hypothetical protein CLUG_04052, partial [Clavispora lusitaniae ATCC 42720]